jgi:hypothetical protein
MIKSITLYFDSKSFKQDSGEELTQEQMESFARELNEIASHFIGYVSWEVGKAI